MTPDGLKPKPRRKLNRKQVQDVLERNIKLYKDEESFIEYLVDLAVYLVEYEYDWSDSDSEPPPHVKLELEAERPRVEPAPKPIPKRAIPPMDPLALNPAPQLQTPRPTPIRPPAPQIVKMKPEARVVDAPLAPAPKMSAVPGGSAAGTKTPAGTTPEAVSQPEQKSRRLYHSADLRRATDTVGQTSGGRRCEACGTALRDESICPGCRNVVI